MSVRFDFAGKGVVVTGGARGIGFAAAVAFLRAGARVAIWDYDSIALNQAKDEIERLRISTGPSTGSELPQIVTQTVDVTSSKDCESAAGALPFSIDILINNAGITRDKTLAKMTDEEFTDVVDTNLNGLFRVTKALLPRLNSVPAPPTNSDLRPHGKRIINIASVVAHYGNYGQTNYAAAKAGVVGFTKSLARELARKGFTVNAVAPGFTQTAMVMKIPEEMRRGIAERVPVGRFGTPEDIANACLFLASEEASYINGTVLSVDGGLVL